MSPAQADDEYMISDYDLMVNRYISVPKTYGTFNPGAVVAGIVRGMLQSAGFAARCVFGGDTASSGACARCGTCGHRHRIFCLPVLLRFFHSPLTVTECSMSARPDTFHFTS